MTVESSENETSTHISLKTVIIGAIAGFIIIHIIIFALGILGAVVWGQSAQDYLEYLRNLFTITLSVTGILIIISTGILIIQIARFINLLRSEIKPISQDAKLAINNIRTTTEFVQQHAIKPVIQTQAFLAGLLKFLYEIIRITQLLQSRDNPPQNMNDTKTQDSI